MGKTPGKRGLHYFSILSLLAALLFWLAPSSYAQSQRSTPDLPTYLAQLRSAQRALADEPTTATVREVQETLTTVKAVTLPSGEPLTLQPLIGTDETISAEEAQARLALLIEQLTAADQDQTAARLALLATIFERPAFVGQESLWQRFWRWLRQWLPDWDQENSASQASWLGAWTTVLGWLILGLAAVLLLFLLSLWLQNLLANFVLSDPGRAGSAAANAEPQTAAEARQQAQQLAGAGSYREAVRRMYLAALLTLHERNQLHYDRSNTNREVLATVRNQPVLYARLQPLVETFDDVWYGVREPDRTTFDRYVQAVQGLEEEA